jgi:hypothetical protein
MEESMGLAFLPWERLPLWLLGPLMIAAGIFLTIQSELYSWRFFEAICFSAAGIIVFIYGIKRLRAEGSVKRTGDGK